MTTVLFCDICNESVPQSDLDAGRARRLKGRVVCSVCERSMSGAEPSPAGGSEPQAAPIGTSASAASGPAVHAVPPPPTADVHRPRPRRDSGALVGASLALLAVLVAVGVGLRLSWDIEESKEAYDRSLRTAIRDYRAEALSVRETTEALRLENERFLATLRDELDAYARDLAAAQDRWMLENDQVMAELVDFDAELTEIKELVGLIERHDKEMIGLQAKFATLLDDMTKHAARIAALEERPVVTIEPPIGGGAGAPQGGDEREQPAWTKLLAGLDSPNADERWMAVDELGQTGDPAVADELVRMLQDEDTFVRMATARILGDLEAPAGIPALIGALEDDEAAVREAALVALQAICGRTFDFDPHAGPADRAKRVKAWRKWWDKEEDDWLPAE